MTKYKEYLESVPVKTHYIFLLSALLLVLGNVVIMVAFTGFITIFFLKDLFLTGDRNLRIYSGFIWLLMLAWGIYIAAKTYIPIVGFNYYIATIVMPFLMFQFIMNSEIDAIYLRKLFNFLFAGGWILSFFSLYNLMQAGFDFYTRIGSVWPEINIMSEFFLILFMFCLSFLLHRKRGEPYLFHLITLILLGFSMFLTQTRGVWMGLLFAVALLFIRKPKIFIAAVIIVALFFAAFQSVIMVKVLSVVNFEKDLSSLGRLQAWMATIMLLKSNYLTGYGFDAFMAYRDMTYSVFLVPVIHSHNTYLRAMLEMGLIGTVIYFSFLVRAFIYSSRNYDREKKKDYVVYLDGLKLSFLSMAVTFMFEPYLSLFGGTLFAIWLLVSIAFKINQNMTSVTNFQLKNNS